MRYFTLKSSPEQRCKPSHRLVSQVSIWLSTLTRAGRARVRVSTYRLKPEIQIGESDDGANCW